MIKCEMDRVMSVPLIHSADLVSVYNTPRRSVRGFLSFFSVYNTPWRSVKGFLSFVFLVSTSIRCLDSGRGCIF